MYGNGNGNESKNFNSNSNINMNMNNKRIGRDRNPKMDLDDLLDINEIPVIKNEKSPGNDFIKVKIKNESPGRRNVGNSPNRIEKPNFFAANNSLNNPNTLNNNLNSVNPNNASKNPSSYTNFTNLSQNSNQSNANKSKSTKNQDLFTNNLNNIFNAFSNSSLINPLNNGTNMTSNMNMNIKQYGRNEASPTRRKAELIQNVTNHYNKERKNSPLKFNALFSNPLVNNGMIPNINIKKKEDSNASNASNLNNSNASHVNNLPVYNSNASSVDNLTTFYSVKEYSYSEDKNPRFRNTMEDFGKIIDNYMNDKSKGFFSLYDGHGGSDPVKYAKERMPEILSKLIKESESTDMSDKKDIIEQSLIASFHKLDDELKFTDSETSGSTACIVLITQEAGRKCIYTANVGDSKCVLISSDGVVKLSYDHKCSDQGEVERVKQSGGIVFSGRVFGQLVLTRALGDHSLKKYGVIATPYVTKTLIEENHKYVVLASDGVWDILTEEEILKLSLNINTADEFAKLLVKTALNGGSKDNISCIVIKI